MRVSEIEASLAGAIEAAERLGLDASEARAVATTIRERGGYPDDLYVLVLAGGTGVGKSSLLNALAGREVSPPGLRRPTTTSPVALVPASSVEAAGPLLEWLGGAELRTQVGDGPAVAIVDLPDLDSVEAAHAAVVDAVLPRADAVLWVMDPEKYDDAVLHDRYLRRWMPRLAQQAAVINKVDRLAPAEAVEVAADLGKRLAEAGLPRVQVMPVSALHDVGPVRAWLAGGASAKEVVNARIRQGAAEAVRALAVAAGVEGSDPPAPLVGESRQATFVSEGRQAMLDLVGVRGLRTKAANAVRASARPVGGGPLGLLRSLAERGAGVSERDDPRAYLRRWRERGSLDRPVGALVHALTQVAAGLPPPLRAGMLDAATAPAISERLAQGLDGIVARASERPLPSSRLWPLLGLGQLAATALVVIAAIWLVALFLTGRTVPTATLELPLLGPMPMPAALAIVGLLAWFVLGRWLRWHAGRLGRRWADDVGGEIAAGVTGLVHDTLAGQVEAVEASRSELWRSLQATGGASPNEGPA